MPFITVEDAARKAFDYVVIGGGVGFTLHGILHLLNTSNQTSGLTAAVRLSEDPSATVLVLEAGTSETFVDPNIDIPAQFGQVVGNPQVRLRSAAAEDLKLATHFDLDSMTGTF